MGVDKSQIYTYFTLIYLVFCYVLSPFCEHLHENFIFKWDLSKRIKEKKKQDLKSEKQGILKLVSQHKELRHNKEQIKSKSKEQHAAAWAFCVVAWGVCSQILGSYMLRHDQPVSCHAKAVYNANFYTHDAAWWSYRKKYIVLFLECLSCN